MAFARLHYKKDWNNPADFPTHEDSEAQVRLDLQFHPDAVRDYVNDTLLPALEDGRGAVELGTTEGSLQAVLDQIKADLQTLAAGGAPSVSQCVRVDFEQDGWAREAEDGPYTLAIAQETHRRYGAAFGFNLWHRVDGALRNDTWTAGAARVSAPLEGDGSIRLISPEPFSGQIVFFGV